MIRFFVFTVVFFCSVAAQAELAPIPDASKIKQGLSKTIDTLSWKQINGHHEAKLNGDRYVIDSQYVMGMFPLSDTSDQVKLYQIVARCLKITESVVGNLSDAQQTKVIDVLKASIQVPNKQVSDTVGSFRFYNSASNLGNATIFNCGVQPAYY